MSDKRYFQGAFAPAFLFEYVEAGTIPVAAAWLWLNINSFQRAGRRCYMSNAALATRLSLQIRKVQYHIANMEELGMLVRRMDGEQRILTTTVPVDPPCTSVHTPMHTSACPPCTSVHAEEENGKKSLSPVPATANERHPRWKKMATTLATAIQLVRKINCTSNLSAWAKQFEMLHTINKVEPKRIKKALRWYCEQLPVRHGDKFFLVLHSGAAFRERFSKLEAAIERDAAERAEQDGDSGGLEPGEIPITSINIGSVSDDEWKRIKEDN